MSITAYGDTFARDHLPVRESWPELRFDLPELQYPERLNCVAELLDKSAPDLAGKTAIQTLEASWTYTDLQHAVNRIARVLQEDLRLITGNRVLLRGANTPMMAACVLAVMKAGYIAVPTMPLLRTQELTLILDKAQVDAVLCADDLREEMEAACGNAQSAPAVLYFNHDAPAALEQRMAGKPAHLDAVDTLAEDICLIGFTSGTTGVPKGTMHFHRDILAICDCFPRSTLHSLPDDIFIGTPPLAFTFGLGGLLLFPLRIGATAVLLDKTSPEGLLQAIERFHATVCFTAPLMYRQMAHALDGAAHYDLSSLRKTVSAGEVLPVATREQWLRASGLHLIDGIGSTEMLHIFISAGDDAVRPGATGKPIPGYQACVLDAGGKPVGAGVVGQLAVKGPTGCRYLADERQADYVRDGWNLTGDAYEIDADGYFWYRARVDDMIIAAGYNIAAPEVEHALLMHEAVAECGVTAWPDEDRGQIVKAFVVLKTGCMPTAALCGELQDFVKRTIAPYKYPRAIEFCAELPRTASGKLQRHRLGRP